MTEYKNDTFTQTLFSNACTTPVGAGRMFWSTCPKILWTLLWICSISISSSWAGERPNPRRWWVAPNRLSMWLAEACSHPTIPPPPLPGWSACTSSCFSCAVSWTGQENWSWEKQTWTFCCVFPRCSPYGCMWPTCRRRWGEVGDRRLQPLGNPGGYCWSVGRFCKTWVGRVWRGGQQL